ncbi:MAG: MipA/OmpV family protein [Cephaloticoccus sp.]|nr:MipA/OmpV family protein [Cephaloticoccus sp.]
MNQYILRTFLALGFLQLAVLGRAQPTKAAEGWSVSVGGGAIWAPAFPGSNDYQLMVVPDVRVNYGEVFFASVDKGIGYNLINNESWVAGPVAKVDFGRKADGDSTFRVAGSKSNALIGFQDLDATMQVGAFVSHRSAGWTTKLELVQALGGHEGLTADVSLEYLMNLSESGNRNGPPLLFATGPRLRWADANYTNAYFGVTVRDALATGLPAYRTSSGVNTLGWGAAVVRPINRQLSFIAFAGYDRLLGDAADSPLVQQRGSENQFSLGLLLAYKL